MKTIDEAFAATSVSEQLRILESVLPEEYPHLLEEVEIRRKLLHERHSKLKYGSEAYCAQRQELKPQEFCLDLAKLVAWQAKPKLPKDFRIEIEVLLCSEVISFMRRVKPSWLSVLIQRKMNEPDIGSKHELVLGYVRAGLIEPPPPESGYYSGLAYFVCRKAAERLDLAKEFLLQNRDLVERDLPWVIRQYSEKKSRYSNDPVLRRNPEGKLDTTLFGAVAELCNEGHFNPTVLIITALETMPNAPREHEARVLIEVHRDLSPSDEFCLEKQSMYLSLLVSPLKPLVRFGIDQVSRICQMEGFDAAGFVEQLSAVLSHNSQPLRIASLELTKVVAAANPEIAARVPEFIAPVLLNPSPKLQAAALDLFKSLPVSASSAIAAAIQPFAERILPSLRFDFTEWVSVEPVGQARVSPATDDLRELGEPVSPVISAEDLVFIANELLDRDPEPMQFERFLDGLAHFAPANRKLLATKFSPLQKRALKSLTETSPYGDAPSLLIFTSRLILILGPDAPGHDDFRIGIKPPDACGWRPHTLGPNQSSTSVIEFARARIDEVLADIRDERSLPLLALPEFDLGFISPATLLERFEFYKKAGRRPGHFDFIQAIARCDLGGLNLSSLQVPMSEDEASRVLRFLFSGQIVGDVDTSAWWLAAARTREPFGDFSEDALLGCHAGENMPDWLTPAVYRQPSSGIYGGCSDESVGWRWRSSPLIPRCLGVVPPDRLYPLQHGVCIRDYGRYGSDLRWRYSFTPGLLDAVVAQDLQYTCYFAGLSEKSALNAASAVMAELARRRLPLRYTLQVHLLMALNSAGKAEREAGVELLIQASEDGRLAPAVPGMGEVFSRLMRGDPKPENWTLQLSWFVPSLRQLSLNGPLLQVQIRDILLAGLENPPLSVPRGLPSLLELLLDLVTAHPPAVAFDLEKAWGIKLKANVKTLAAQIAGICISSTRAGSGG